MHRSEQPALRVMPRAETVCVAVTKVNDEESRDVSAAIIAPIAGKAKLLSATIVNVRV